MTLSYVTSSKGGTCESYPAMAPRSFEDCLSKEFSDWLKLCAEDQAVMALAATAFPCRKPLKS